MGQASVEGAYHSEFSGFVQFCFGVPGACGSRSKASPRGVGLLIGLRQRRRGDCRPCIHACRASGGTSPSVEGLPRQGRGEAGKGRGPKVAQQRLGRSARSALRVPRQITEKRRPQGQPFSVICAEGGLSGASMHPIPARVAPRDPPAAVRFCSCRTVEPRRGFSPPIPSARQTQKGHPVGGPFAFVWRREGDPVETDPTP